MKYEGIRAIMEKLARIMKSKNVTAYELSKATGLSMCHCYRILRGEKDIKVSTLLKISNFLQIPAFMLIDDDFLKVE